MNYAELGQRIRQARESVSMSQDDVASRLEIPRSAISLIESGKRKIDSLELQAFSRLVGKSILFFLDDRTSTVESADLDDDPTQILFSGNQAVDISQDRQQIDRFQQFHRNFGSLATMLDRLPNSYSDEPIYNVFKPTPAAARWMAGKERARLGLTSSSPIRDMWDILESEGVKVMAWNLRTPKLGGCFIFSRSLGSFVLVKSNIGASSGNMLNFVLAHEYCHHLIHKQRKGFACDPGGNYRQPEEYFAQWFAAAFLMPEEALVPRLVKYAEEAEGSITAEVVMHLALDFGVSYTAMLNRLSARGVELIDKEAYKQLAKEPVGQLMSKIGRYTPDRSEKLKHFPEEYTNMAFEAYSQGSIGLGKLAELLELPIEEAKAQLQARNIPVDLGVNSEADLLNDIENA
jgi:Zn-dependent peptidase ImmA (M78 family)/DNA-binding XRE family transcriptional regulator